MVSYHINPETGNANMCRATKRCPFGDLQADHYPTADVARAAYEKKMSAPLAATRTVDPGERGAGAAPVYELLPGRKDEAVKSIEKANRRLEKFGITDRFEYTLEEKFRTHRHRGIELAKRYYELTLNAPTIGLEGHRFLAVITEADGGFVTRTGQEVELHGWRPESMLCEHCGQKRPRSKTYLVEGPDGKRHQIGSSCVQAYLGVKPEGLWALGYDPVEKLAYEGEGTVPRSASSHARPVKDTLAYALAVSNGGENFTSKSSAMNYNLTSTDEAVNDALFGSTRDGEGWRDDMAVQAAGYLADGTVDKVLEHIRTMEGMNDYAMNVRTIAKGEWVSPRDSALLVSGLGSYRRSLAIEKPAVEVPKPAAGYAGYEGELLKGRKARVSDVSYFSGINAYTGQDETRTRLTLLDEDNHELVWWTSSDVPVEENQEVTFKGGRISKHGHFKGVDQTILSRVEFEEVPPAAE